MKPQGKNNIFKSTTCLDKELLLLYAKNRLTTSQKHQAELHLVDCELCSDALEGFQLLSGTVVLEDTINEVKKLTVKKTGSGTKIKLEILLAAASLIFIVGLTLWIFHQLYEPTAVNRTQAERKTEPIPEPVVNLPEVSDEKSQLQTTIEVKKSALIIPKELSSPVPISDEKKITPEKSEPFALVESALATEELSSDGIPENQQYNKQSSAGMEMEITPATRAVADMEVTSKSTNNNNTIRYIEGLKTIIPIANNSMDDSLWLSEKQGIEARYEHQTAKKEYKNLEMEERKTILYADFLSEGIIHFKQKNYADALAIFNQVLSHRNNDPNALFYGGLCYDGLKNYKMAETYLLPVTKNTGNAFYEEGKWNLANIYLKQNKTKEAVVLLNEIKNEKGFYNLKASEKLQKIK